MPTSSSPAPPGLTHGFEPLPAPVDVNGVPSGTWVATGLSVLLPSAGTYHLDALIRAQLSAPGPNVNTWVIARLWDVTAGAALPETDVLIYQLAVQQPAGDEAITLSGNGSAPIMAQYTVPGPRTIRLEAARHNTTGAAGVAMIRSDPAGRTTLRWVRVA